MMARNEREEARALVAVHEKRMSEYEGGIDRKGKVNE
jgi:hypothetical protein